MSAAGTGFYYTTKRVRGKDKLNLVKYDPVGKNCFPCASTNTFSTLSPPVVKQHVLFKEAKIK
jgi:ribosomal protein L33